MRYGIISDIHGNLAALEAVFAALKGEGVDELLCLGDLVGYGPRPEECVRIMIEAGAPCVKGNHDAAAVDLDQARRFNPYARQAIEWTAAALSEESRDYLAGRDLFLRGSGFHAVHGAMTHHFHYLATRADAEANFELMEVELLFVGHSHVAEFFVRSNAGTLREPLAHGGEVRLESGRSYIVNCGSVGQPRDSNPLAAYCVYDTESRLVAVKRVAYPIDVTQAGMREAGLHRYLIERLELGR